MAYISQDKKKQIAVKLNDYIKPLGIKATLSIKRYSKLQCTIKSGKFDFLGDYYSTAEYINIYAKQKGFLPINQNTIKKDFTEEKANILNNISQIINTDNFTQSDNYGDYRHVGFYTNISIGDWDKPYKLEA